MIADLRKIVEQRVIGGSIPRLVRLGKSLSPGLIHRIQMDGFRRVVRYTAARQKFFARKLQEAGLRADEIRRPEDLGEIFTTPEDIRNLPAEEFLCREPESVFETTGTSGGPKRVYFGYDEVDFSARYEAAAFYENGMRPGDRVVCTFDGGYWISPWVTYLACKQLGVFCSAVGKPTPAEVYDRLGHYHYNVIVADPTWLVSLSEIAEKQGSFPVKLIFAAGDRMTDPYREYVQRIWNAPVILGYGSTEMGGGAGMECLERNGYHVDEFNMLFEILDPDPDGYGELVVTTLSRRTTPLIRYRVRDVTRFLDGPCPCGTTVRRLARIRGRRDEMVVMGAGNMYPEIFEKILCDVPGLSSNWQVAVRQEGLHDILEFRLELTNGVSTPAVEDAVRKNLEARYPDVWANQVCGMYKLAFRFCSPGTLVQGRKRKRLVDERGE